ncbi:hypothetical protein [Celeribacter halophilus]|uniref:Uncharacterized protein n=1 Tax=Celeribacter halophilus TaxID=576117 RepID=A0A1I3MQK5_9RHOB|nr:hypothetical protein [Celeribacter halophilus]PZX15475.1 hypothetical protein LX82_00105 [Celeribacter halophilus]SFI99239.1 hypothetical protein SAMN04488138_101105 [Celeribacter halophilus]
MSDPMTNLDTDDVLASIRRLVAETHSQPHDPVRACREQAPLTLKWPLNKEALSEEAAAPAPEAEPEADAPAALVLTPDFRVEKPEVATSEAEPEAPRADASPVPPLVLSPEQAVHLPKDEPASVKTVSVEALVSEELHSAVTESSDVAQEAPKTESWNAALDDTPDEVAAAHVARLSLEQRIAELEAAVGAQAAEWEPDGSEDLEAEIPRVMPRAFAETGARVFHFQGMPEATSEETREEAAQAPFDADGVEMTQARDNSDQIDDAEVIEETSFEAAQEAAAADVETDTVIAQADVAEADDAELSEATEAEGVAPDPDPSLEEELALAGYAEEDILDEEALRELVAQVIREELQGELGQRITRNVRRLVRREVQRALTLREFE